MSMLSMHTTDNNNMLGVGCYSWEWCVREANDIFNLLRNEYVSSKRLNVYRRYVELERIIHMFTSEPVLMKMAWLICVDIQAIQSEHNDGSFSVDCLSSTSEIVVCEEIKVRGYCSSHRRRSSTAKPYHIIQKPSSQDGIMDTIKSITCRITDMATLASAFGIVCGNTNQLNSSVVPTAGVDKVDAPNTCFNTASPTGTTNNNNNNNNNNHKHNVFDSRHSSNNLLEQDSNKRSTEDDAVMSKSTPNVNQITNFRRVSANSNGSKMCRLPETEFDIFNTAARSDGDGQSIYETKNPNTKSNPHLNSTLNSTTDLNNKMKDSFHRFDNNGNNNYDSPNKCKSHRQYEESKSVDANSTNNNDNNNSNDNNSILQRVRGIESCVISRNKIPSFQIPPSRRSTNCTSTRYSTSKMNNANLNPLYYFSKEDGTPLSGFVESNNNSNRKNSSIDEVNLKVSVSTPDIIGRLKNLAFGNGWTKRCHSDNSLLWPRGGHKDNNSNQNFRFRKFPDHSFLPPRRMKIVENKSNSNSFHIDSLFRLVRAYEALTKMKEQFLNLESSNMLTKYRKMKQIIKDCMETFNYDDVMDSLDYTTFHHSVYAELHSKHLVQ